MHAGRKSPQNSTYQVTGHKHVPQGIHGASVCSDNNVHPRGVLPVHRTPAQGGSKLRSFMLRLLYELPGADLERAAIGNAIGFSGPNRRSDHVLLRDKQHSTEEATRDCPPFAVHPAVGGGGGHAKRNRDACGLLGVGHAMFIGRSFLFVDMLSALHWKRRNGQKITWLPEKTKVGSQAVNIHVVLSGCRTTQKGQESAFHENVGFDKQKMT